MPEGDCYEAHAMFIIDLAGKHNRKELKLYKLCHGLVLGKTGDVENKWFGHAWIEYNKDVLIDVSNNKKVICRKEQLKDRIDESSVKRYGVLEALNKLLIHQHFGPWEEEK